MSRKRDEQDVLAQAIDRGLIANGAVGLADPDVIADAVLAAGFRRDPDAGLRERVEAVLTEVCEWEWTAPIGPGNASYANGYRNALRHHAADQLRTALAEPTPGSGQ